MALINVFRRFSRQCVRTFVSRQVTVLLQSPGRFISNDFVRKMNKRSGVGQLRMLCGTTSGHCSHTVQCWKCGTRVDQHRIIFCKSCHTVQRPQDRMDYFEIFGQEKTFDLDVKQLTNRFRLLQMQLHPDRFSNHTKEEKEVSAEYSSLVNRAYRTLLSPLDRALYLLELHGYPLVENEIHLGTDFFSEIMEINEELADIESAEDLEKFSNENLTKMDNLFRKASEAFKNEDWSRARKLIGKLRYFANIQERIKEIEGERGFIKS